MTDSPFAAPWWTEDVDWPMPVGGFVFFHEGVVRIGEVLNPDLDDLRRREEAAGHLVRRLVSGEIESRAVPFPGGPSTALSSGWWQIARQYDELGPTLRLGVVEDPTGRSIYKHWAFVSEAGVKRLLERFTSIIHQPTTALVGSGNVPGSVNAAPKSVPFWVSEVETNIAVEQWLAQNGKLRTTDTVTDALVFLWAQNKNWPPRARSTFRDAVVTRRN